MQLSAWALPSFAMPINEPPMSPAAEMSSRYPVRIRWFGCCWWSMICVWEVSDVCSCDDLKIAGMIGWGVDGDQGWPWCWSQVPVDKPLLAETSTTTLHHLYGYRPIGCYWKRVTSPTQHNKLYRIVPILNIKKLSPLSSAIYIEPASNKKTSEVTKPQKQNPRKTNYYDSMIKGRCLFRLGELRCPYQFKKKEAWEQALALKAWSQYLVLWEEL